MSKTFKPKKRKRSRKHGFFARKRSVNGKRTVARRRKKGRVRLTA